ncbi:MAG: YolD-like family protein [Oscillospiraceae bacterium]|nr:YolD-like family protein [Oscillospiraceae bacterium]
MGKYDNIMRLGRPYDPNHEPMSMHNRAAQFAPFDALTGFGGRIYESSRLTEERIELCDEQKLEINQRIRLIQEHIKERPKISITYFIPDKTKDGGAYRTVTGVVHKIDEYDERLWLEDDSCIAFVDILSLDGPLFAESEA